MYLFNFEVFWITISPSVYGLMYALSFLFWFYILKKRWFFNKNQLDDIFIYIFVWVILWWRLWYILFYNLDYYTNNISDILKFWEWWMSFHWWVIWVVIAMILFSYKNNLNFYKVADQICWVLPIWLGLWRLWNYANNELLGYSWYNWLLAININWVNYFPSTLLEALLEGLVLYIILYYIYKHQKFSWQIASVFLIWYWVFRLIVELFFRQPDSHIWYVFSVFSMWSLLTIPMIIFWVFFYIYLNKKNIK
jgi:phosphatidylglycerol:prolipoprotein diacylglycerol transferase